MKISAAESLVECENDLHVVYKNLFTIVERICPTTECSKCPFKSYMGCDLLDMLESVEHLLDEDFIIRFEKENNERGVFSKMYSGKDMPYCRRIIMAEQKEKTQHWYREIHSTEEKRLSVKAGDDW